MLLHVSLDSHTRPIPIHFDDAANAVARNLCCRRDGRVQLNDDVGAAAAAVLSASPRRFHGLWRRSHRALP